MRIAVSARGSGAGDEWGAGEGKACGQMDRRRVRPRHAPWRGRQAQCPGVRNPRSEPEHGQYQAAHRVAGGVDRTSGACSEAGVFQSVRGCEVVESLVLELDSPASATCL